MCRHRWMKGNVFTLTCKLSCFILSDASAACQSSTGRTIPTQEMNVMTDYSSGTVPSEHTVCINISSTHLQHLRNTLRFQKAMY